MPDPATGPRWLVVVRRDRADLFASLARAFAAEAPVEAVLDRRLGERRDQRVAVPRERRRRARRRRPSSRDLTLWEAAGFRLVEAARAPAAVAPGPAPAAAPPEAPAVEPIVVALQPALPGLAALLGSLAVPDGPGTRLALVSPWLDRCVEALRAERLDLCRSYLALAIRTLEMGAPHDREAAAP